MKDDADHVYPKIPKKNRPFIADTTLPDQTFSTVTNPRTDEEYSVSAFDVQNITKLSTHC